VILKIDSAEYVLSAHSPRDFPAEKLPEVAFVGRSNVGKSSLLNRVLGRRALARTSSTPGRTQAINYFRINRKFWFVDLPGYGYAKASKDNRQAWARLVEAYLQQEPDRRLVVLLVDGKVGATASDAEAADYLRSLGVGLTVVMTKMDKVPRARWRANQDAARKALRLHEGSTPLPVSAETGDGMQELWRALSAHLGNHP
jgi:GTP-binding protein